MTKMVLLLGIFIFITSEVFCAVHTGQLEISTFLGRQRAQKSDNSTFCGGLQLGLELVEIGTIEFSAETGFGSYPENKQRVRNFDIVLKSNLYNGEMFFPYLIGGIGLMTFNRTGQSSSEGESSVTFAKTTVNTGMGFRIRINKGFFARLDQKYFLFTKDGSLTYRSLSAFGISYLF